MGSSTRQAAEARFSEALQQALNDADTLEEREHVFEDAIRELVNIAYDEEEVHRIAAYLSTDPNAIDWPDGYDAHNPIE